MASFPGRVRRSQRLGAAKPRRVLSSSLEPSPAAQEIEEYVQAISEGVRRFQQLDAGHSTAQDAEEDFHGFLDEEIEHAESNRRILTGALLNVDGVVAQEATENGSTTPRSKRRRRVFKEVTEQPTQNMPNNAKTPQRKTAEQPQPPGSGKRQQKNMSVPEVSKAKKVSAEAQASSTLSSSRRSVESTQTNAEERKRKSKTPKCAPKTKKRGKFDTTTPTKSTKSPPVQEAGISQGEDEDFESEDDVDPHPAVDKDGKKLLIRPSKLGGFGTLSSPTSPAFASPTNQTNNSLFGSSSQKELIIEGKRQWKPSKKVQEKIKDEGENSAMKKSIMQYANAIAAPPKPNSDAKKTMSEDEAEEKSAMQQKIKKILASQWSSRLRRVDNKYVKANNRQSSSGSPVNTDAAEEHPKKVLLRESKLELNQGLLQQMRKATAEQMQFCHDIQQSIQSADKTPPKLVNSNEDNINPAGAALVEVPSPTKKSPAEAVAESGLSSKQPMSGGSSSNRMPGNIVCGICGAVRYYAFILQAKKFGTFSCEPCRKFISKTIRRIRNEPLEDGLQLSCISDQGTCVVPPVLKANSMTPKKSSDPGAESTRCQACWLKLCLIGYNLENDLYDSLRAHLPEVIRRQLPEAAKRGECRSLVPNRGQILEFNRQVPLSRPLFDGFGEEGLAKDASSESGLLMKNPDAKMSPAKQSVENATGSLKGKQSSHIVHERLPNGWTKKAVKRLSGDEKGKWDMFLITPDQKMLKSPLDLKLYIAKSGAVIDSNIINFALPKKTAKVAKSVKQKENVEENVEDVKQEKLLDNSPVVTASPAAAVGSSPVFPRSSRRSVVVPLKYRSDGDLGSAEAEKIQKTRLIEQMKKQQGSTKKKQRSSLPSKESQEEPVDDNLHSPHLSNEKKATKSPIPASKSAPTTTVQDLTTIGVGTFSIDKDSVHSMTSNSISDIRFKMSKRTVACKKCANCVKDDCLKCQYCLDSKKRGGKGLLKKICVERRCLDPIMPGLPAMSTFRSGMDVRRGYVRVATAVATKSAPPPPPPHTLIDSSSPNGAEESLGCNSVPKQEEKAVFSEPGSVIEQPPVATELPAQLTTLSQEPSGTLALQTPTTTPSAPVLQSSSPGGIIQLVEQPSPIVSAVNTPSSTIDDGSRPRLSYAGLIAEALTELPGQRGTLSMIYQFIMEKYSFYRNQPEKTAQWQNSIRHNLSLHKEFVHSEKERESKGSYWSIAPGVDLDEVFFKHRARARQREQKELQRSQRDQQQRQPFITPTTSPAPVKVITHIALNQPPVVSAVAKPAVTTMPSKKEEHDQSLVEYLRIGMMQKSPKKITTTRYLSGSEALMDRKVVAPEVAPSREDEETVPIPVPPPQKVTSTKTVPTPSHSTSKSGAAVPPYFGSMDYWTQYDPEEVAQRGHSVITNEKLPVDALCFMCGSAGQEEMLFCKTCCEPFHPFCLQQGELPQSEETEREWLCPRCAICRICGTGGGNQLRCKECAKAFHEECVQESQRILKDKNNFWTCFQCLRCSSCGKADASHYDESDSKPLCSTCCLQRKKGSFCPICRGCYDDNDYEARMMECAKCGGWVHAKCEGVDAEKYQILSHLPDSVDYICKICHAEPSTEAGWMQAVAAELRIGQEAVLAKLLDAKVAQPFRNASNTSVVAEVTKEELSQVLREDDRRQSECEDRVKRKLSFDACESAINTLTTPTKPGNDAQAVAVSPINSQQEQALSSAPSPSSNEVSSSAGIQKLRKVIVPSILKRPNLEVQDVRSKSVEIYKEIELPSPVVNSNETLVDDSKYVTSPCSVLLQDIGPYLPNTSRLKSSTKLDPKLKQICVVKLNRKDVSDAIANASDKEEANVTTDVVHKISDQLDICPQNEVVEETSHVLDLSELQQRVSSSNYKSVLYFHLDFQRVCNTVHIFGPEKRKRRLALRQAYAAIIQEVFPWFNINDPAAMYEPQTLRDSCVRVPHPDHAYADTALEHYMPTHKRRMNQPVWKSKKCRLGLASDTRKCSLCNKVGDAPIKLEGRLLYYRQNDWVHVNCALWSSEVYEEVDGSLINVGQAVHRSSKLICTFCQEKGATIGCCHRDCICNFHFGCAREARATFKEDKSLYCIKHQSIYLRKSNNRDFEVARTVHIDLEAEARRKSRLVDLRKVRVHLGSLTVTALGDIQPDLAEMTSTAAVPIGFTCSRLFWSTNDPHMKVRYKCKTRVVFPKAHRVEGHINDHLVLAHTGKDDQEAENVKKLQKFRRFLRKLELEEMRKKPTEILPPALVSKLWKHLKPADIRKEWLEDSLAKENLSPVELRGSQDPVTPTNKVNTNTAPHTPISSPQKQQEAGSAQKLNKAIGNVLRRTPSKLFSEEELPDLVLGNGDLGIEADNDIISAILRDGNFEEELRGNVNDLSTRPDQWSASQRPRLNPVVNELDSIGHLLPQHPLPPVAEDVTIEKTWFNRHLGKKLSEVAVHCCLPFSRSNFEQDDFALNIGHETFEENRTRSVEKSCSPINENYVYNVLGLEAEKAQGENVNSEHVDPKLALAVDSTNLIVIPPSKPAETKAYPYQVCQLDGADDSAESSKSENTSQSSTVDLAEELPPAPNCEKVEYKCDNCLTAFDSMSDIEAHVQVCTGMSALSNKTEQQQLKAPEATSRKREATASLGESPPAKKGKSGTDAPDEAIDEASPRRDFSIAGILSPPSQGDLSQVKVELIDKEAEKIAPQKQGEQQVAANVELKPPKSGASSDDEVVVLPTPPKKTVSKPDARSARKSLARGPQPSTSAPLPSRALSQPPAHQVSSAHNSPLLIAHQIGAVPQGHTYQSHSFQQHHQQHPGLQYAANMSMPTLAQVPGLAGDPFQQAQLLQVTPQGFLAAVHAQPVSYMTPQGIVVTQPNYMLASQQPPQQPGAIFYSSAGAPTYLGGAQPVPGGLYPSLNPAAATLSVPPPRAVNILGTRYPVAPMPANPVPLATPQASVSTLPSSSSVQSTPTKKIARVQPQPATSNTLVKPLATKPTSSTKTSSGSHSKLPTPLDPIKALSTMASQPMSSLHPQSAATVGHLSINHQDQRRQKYPSGSAISEHRSVGTQARISGPLKIITPRPWKGSESASSSPKNAPSTPTGSAEVQLVSDRILAPAQTVRSDISAPRQTAPAAIDLTKSIDVAQLQPVMPAYELPAPTTLFINEDVEGAIGLNHTLPNGVVFNAREAQSSGITIVLGKDSVQPSLLKVEEISVTDGTKHTGVDPDVAMRAIKSKTKTSRKTRVNLPKASLIGQLDGRGRVPHTRESFVNEQELNGKESTNKKIMWKPVDLNEESSSEEENKSHVIYELTSEDGSFSATSSNASEVWEQLFVAVQEARRQHSMEPMESNPLCRTGAQMLGLTHAAIVYLMEQLPGGKQAAAERLASCQQLMEDLPVPENPTGCARAETYKGRAPLDMFSWLASEHRSVPHPSATNSNLADRDDSGPSCDLDLQHSANRRATSLDLPMAMRFRHLARNAKEAVGVYRSGIHGRGLYCKREIQCGEMVIEYAGEEIRSVLTDKREKYYESKDIGCYMFKVDDDTVVDATMKGNAARFINHSCDPNCYSKIVDILGKKHILIFAMRKIYPGEELTYDYKFPIEDVKLPCMCGAKKCRKYMN